MVEKNLENNLIYYKNLFKWILFKKIKTREQLPIILNSLRLYGEGVEIGVAKGEFSEHLLNKSKLSVLYSIDPWKEFSKKLYNDINNVKKDKADYRYLEVVKKLRKFKSRSKILRLTSEKAAKTFSSESLDFVYIDANHKYKECKKDLELWWPKTKKGGVLAGHDYLNGKLPQGDFGVKKAVDKFIKKYGQKLFITEEENWPSWYIIKK